MHDSEVERDNNIQEEAVKKAALLMDEIFADRIKMYSA